MAFPIAHASDRLAEYPRLGEKLEAFEPREVRRIIVGPYEMRYEIVAGAIIILRLGHGRENRGFEPEVQVFGGFKAKVRGANPSGSPSFFVARFLAVVLRCEAALGLRRCGWVPCGNV